MKKYLNQQDMRDLNLNHVFRLIRAAGPLTRRQIESATDISWGAVSGATALLLQKGYIKEVKISGSIGAGRTPIALAVNDEDHFMLGLDVNRSGLRGVVTDLTGKERFCAQKEVTVTDKAAWIDEIEAMIRTLLDAIPQKRVLAVGIAMQGAVDAKAGIAATFPVEGWQDVPLAAILEERFSLPVFLEHDPDCILYAATAEEELRDAILLRLDNGIGMAVMLNGKIFHRFGAFEIGYTVTDTGERLDALVTIPGLEKQAGLPFAELANAAERGEKNALSHFEKMAERLAAAIVNVTQLFCVEELLLCGKLMRFAPLFLPMLTARTAQLAPEKQLRLRVGDVEKAAVGAALLAAERVTLSFD